MGTVSSFPPLPKKAALNNARAFRQSVLWQQHMKRQKQKQGSRRKTTPLLAYDTKIKVGALNVQGFADTLKLKTCLQIMAESNLDVLFLTETKSTSYYSYTSEEHLVVLSGNHKDKYAGVGAIISPNIRPHLMDVVQVSTRILHLIFGKKGGNIHFVGVYAPHSGLDHDSVREPFWDRLESYVEKIPHPEPVYLTGDFNVSFQAQHKNDMGVTGPYTYGKGKRYIDHSAESNRAICVRAMQRLGMVEAASYKTPNPVHHITYRDKTAPPASWEQFLFDPLILQQVYDIFHFNMGDAATTVASTVRAFLDLPQLPPPSATEPSPDPTRFQRLDHTFVRNQWLSSVCYCRSKLHTGFPSDHYLLVTEVKVRLAHRPPRPRPPPKLNLASLSQSQIQHYNELLRSHLTGTHPANEPPTDHSAMHFYTDGSGSSGRCTSQTPAGWGWCYRRGETWIEASGPVPTTADHSAYLGATVGSNNTGELTAIVEAILYAQEHSFPAAVIHSDSRWAINMITGKWRPRTHAKFINDIRTILKAGPTQIVLRWIKGHAGHEGNELADRLAEQGKITQERTGGRTLIRALPIESAPSSRISPFSSAIKLASEATFECFKRNPRKPWITEDTLQALQQARQAEHNAHPDSKKLRNIAKRKARRDRIAWVHGSLQNNPQGNDAYWGTVRNQKKGFVGRRTHLIHEGKPVPWSQTHEAFRNYLQDTQWSQRVDPDHSANKLSAKPPIRPQAEDTLPFTLEELQAALKKLKPRKAPGPDCIPSELYSLFDSETEHLLLQHYNDVLETGMCPPEWKEALVVSIYKGKGDDTDPASYRPISLLNNVYKIFAAMLQKRISQQTEPFLRSTQYGFRANRGTRHPLFVLRRAMEWSTMCNKRLNLLFLDWKQAFDSIDHSAMLTALERFGIPSNVLRVISSLYDFPSFTVRGMHGMEAQGEVQAGIRQGCPLSPYLFIIVLTVIFHDVDQAMLEQGIPSNTWSEGHPVFDLEYADDTLLLSLTTPQLQNILRIIEQESALYGMSLNNTKTELLRNPAHESQPLYFLDGTRVPEADQVKYLGSLVSWTKPFETAFFHRAALAETTYKKLRLVWNSSLSRNSKLRIFQSTFRASLIYGLDAFPLTTPQLHRIDAYYFRFLRRIIGIKASFYSRVPNHSVWRQAGYPKLPSAQLNNLQRKMMDEVFFSHNTEPLHNVVFCSAYKDRILAQGRRRGMQFPYWIEVVSKKFYPEVWYDHHYYVAHPHNFGPQFKYVELARKLQREKEQASKRASTERA